MMQMVGAHIFDPYVEPVAVTVSEPSLDTAQSATYRPIVRPVPNVDRTVQDGLNPLRDRRLWGCPQNLEEKPGRMGKPEAWRFGLFLLESTSAVAATALPRGGSGVWSRSGDMVHRLATESVAGLEGRFFRRAPSVVAALQKNVQQRPLPGKDGCGSVEDMTQIQAGASHPLVGPHDLLAGQLRSFVSRELSPLPLALHDIGFILPDDKAPRRIKGELPIGYRRRSYKVRTDAGQIYTVTVSGDSILGLPYGADWKTWLAILRWVDEEGVDLDGRLRGVSAYRLLEMAGRTRGSTTQNRMIEAIQRLRHVDITASLLYIPEQLHLEIVEGRRPLLLPGHVDLRRVVEEQARGGGAEREISRNMFLLNAEIDRPRSSSSKSPGQLVDLRINTEILKHVAVGWVTWIHVATHSALQSVTALRLYHLVASYMSRGAAPPFRVRSSDLEDLLGPDRPHRRHTAVLRALDELRRLDVLDGFDVLGTGARAVYVMHPGLYLRQAKNLRGCGLHDTPENRVLLGALAHYGVAPPEARRWIAEDEEQALESVLYVVWCQLSAPAEKRLDNPAGFLTWSRKTRSRQNEVPFQRWLRSATGITYESPARAPQMMLRLPEPAFSIQAPRDGSPLALARFEALKELVRSHEELREWRPWLLHLAPLSMEGDLLVLITSNSFFYERKRESFTRMATEKISLLSEGATRRIEIQLQGLPERTGPP
jgi:hypothetical protein